MSRSADEPTTVTVLGSCGAWPEAGRACSGFLVVHDGFRLVLDLGFGAAAQLFRYCDGFPDAVVVTHEHPDHCADLTALGRAWHFTVQESAAEAPLLPLYCTPGTLQRLEALEPRPHPETIFAMRDVGVPFDVGPFHVTPFELPHHVRNFGVRLTAPGLTLAYTGDSGPSPAVAALATEADLLICEATFPVAPPTGQLPDARTLMTAAEAGRSATEAGAHRLLLTHFWPGSDRTVSAQHARVEYDGEVLIADEGLVVSL